MAQEALHLHRMGIDRAWFERTNQIMQEGMVDVSHRDGGRAHNIRGPSIDKAFKLGCCILDGGQRKRELIGDGGFAIYFDREIIH